LKWWQAHGNAAQSARREMVVMSKPMKASRELQALIRALALIALASMLLQAHPELARLLLLEGVKVLIR
jgi:hypothetical protein